MPLPALEQAASALGKDRLHEKAEGGGNLQAIQDAYQVNEKVDFHSLFLRNVQKEEERSIILLLTTDFSPVLRKNKDRHSSPLLHILNIGVSWLVFSVCFPEHRKISI